MLIGHSMPVVSLMTYSTSLAGGGFLNDTSDGLVDGIPSRKARLQWPTTAGTTAAYMQIQFDLSSSASIRVACLLGLTLPVGTLLAVVLGVSVATVSTRSVRFADGTVGAWFVFPAGLAAVSRVDLRIYNDVSGAATISANTVFDIGEFAAMPAADIELAVDWSDESIDPTEVTMTRDSQPAAVARLPYRRIEGALVVDGRTNVRSGGLAGGLDWMQLRTALNQDRRAIAIPRWRTSAGSVDQAEVNATALYGTGRLGKILHSGGDYYTVPLTFTEAPAV